MSDPTKQERGFPEKSESKSFISQNSLNIYDYPKMEEGGLTYIQKKKWYLIISAAFPIYILVVEIISIIYILQKFWGYKDIDPPSIWYVIFGKGSTSIIILVLSLLQFVRILL